MLKTDIFSPMDDVIGTFHVESEPRAIGFTILLLDPGSPQSYVSVILISKKLCFFKKKKIEVSTANYA